MVFLSVLLGKLGSYSLFLDGGNKKGGKVRIRFLFAFQIGEAYKPGNKALVKVSALPGNPGRKHK